MTPKLSQATFARRLVAAQDRLGFTNAELTRRTGIFVSTISRYRDPEYPSGPPAKAKQGLLERAMGLPIGYFQGAKCDLEKLRQRQEVERWAGTDTPGEAPSLDDVRTRYRDAILALSTGADARGMIRLTLAVEVASKLYESMLAKKEEK